MFEFRMIPPPSSLAFATILGWMAVTAGAAADRGQAHDHGSHNDTHGAASNTASQPAEALNFVGDSYPLSYCVITGEPIEPDQETASIVHEGRHVQFCCDSCKAEFAKDPAKWLEKIDEEIIKQQIELYPLETCIVSGKKLGEMAPPVDIVVGNRLVRLCCPNCEKTVRANPGKYIEQLDAAAIEAQRADYPSDTCIVSGEKLGSQGKIKEIVYAGRLVRLCCPSCAKQFNADPQGYLKKLDGGTSGTSSRPAASAEESSSHDHSGHEH